MLTMHLMMERTGVARAGDTPLLAKLSTRRVSRTAMTAAQAGVPRKEGNTWATSPAIKASLEHSRESYKNLRDGHTMPARNQVCLKRGVLADKARWAQGGCTPHIK